MTPSALSIETIHAGYSVYADMRWPAKTGIGFVMEAVVSRAPPHLTIVDAQVQGRIGAPWSPIAFTRALRARDSIAGVCWSAGFVPPLTSPIPTVITVHDLTHLRFYSRYHRLYYDTVLRPLYKRCSAIVCVSEYTRQEFLDWSGMDAARVHVVLNGVGPVFARNIKTLNLPYPYILYPGNHRAYKNLERLVRAFSMTSLPGSGIRLALTGNANVALVQLTRQLGIESSVCFLGRLKDDELPRLYRGALAVAYVSLYEGFGLPIVEAMAAGVPVLTSNVSAMPEIAGDAALTVDPYSIVDIAAGLEQLANDRTLCAELVGRGKTRASCFDWDRTAQALWGIVDQVQCSA